MPEVELRSPTWKALDLSTTFLVSFSWSNITGAEAECTKTTGLLSVLLREQKLMLRLTQNILLPLRTSHYPNGDCAKIPVHEYGNKGCTLLPFVFFEEHISIKLTALCSDQSSYSRALTLFPQWGSEEEILRSSVDALPPNNWLWSNEEGPTTWSRSLFYLIYILSLPENLAVVNNFPEFSQIISLPPRRNSYKI